MHHPFCHVAEKNFIKSLGAMSTDNDHSGIFLFGIGNDFIFYITVYYLTGTTSYFFQNSPQSVVPFFLPQLL